MGARPQARLRSAEDLARAWVQPAGAKRGCCEKHSRDCSHRSDASEFYPVLSGKADVMNFSVIALFCEDIREEKSGQDTIIGILPDALNVPQFPGALPKLGIYVRFHLNAESEFRSIRTRLRIPGANDLPLATVDESLL